MIGNIFTSVTEAIRIENHRSKRLQILIFFISEVTK